jgi:broad specificity phosphatase PhoE
MNIIGLLRHGQTSWNREKRIQGILDIPLDPDAFYSPFWHQLLEAHGPWDCIVSSPLHRCRQTANLFFPERRILIHDNLREQDWGRWTGHTITDLLAAHADELHCQERRGWDFTPPGGESRKHLLDRVIAAITDICEAHDNARILLVVHLGVIKVLINHLLATPYLPENSAFIHKRALHLIAQHDQQLRLLQANVSTP